MKRLICALLLVMFVGGVLGCNEEKKPPPEDDVTGAGEEVTGD